MEIKEFFDRQLAQWPDARQRFDDLARVQTRDFPENGLRVQWNPARMVSTGAKIDAKSLEKRPCFLCSENRPQVQFSKTIEDAVSDEEYELLVNPFPILPMHFTIPLKSHKPQQIDGHYAMIHQLTAQFPELTVFYNGPRCGASAPDHLHFQAGTGEQLPLRQQWSHLQEHLESVFALNDADSIALLSDFVVPAFVIRSKNAENDRRLFESLYTRLSSITHHPSTTTHQLSTEEEPMLNIVAWREGDTTISVVFPRRKHRPDCYFAEGDSQVLVSPGALDMAGLIITPRQEDFERLTASKAAEILQECAIDAESAQVIAQKTQHSEPMVSVGIVSAQQLKFTLNAPYSVDGIEIEGEQVATFANGAILWNEKIYKQLIFSPKADDASFTLEDVTIGVDFHWNRKETQTFRGTLRLTIDHDKILAINELPVEQYLESVISSEMSGTSSLELLKAHAVISRSWLLAQIEGKKAALKPEKTSQPSTINHQHSELLRWYNREDHALFDVCADDHCQRYQGITRATNPHVAEAVKATHGQVLTYHLQLTINNSQVHSSPLSDGKGVGGEAADLCDTRFSKCCGGRTEEFQYCWENIEKPYLRSVACPWCNTSDASLIRQVLNDYDQETPDFYEWTEPISSEQVAEWLRSKHGIDLGTITDLVPLERGKSGRIWKLKIVGSKGSFTIGKELEIRRTLSDSHLKSSWFEVEKVENQHPLPTTQFILKGKGWGHGVGLCQIGAAVMGEKGHSYDEILQHYYQNTIIKKIY